MSESHGRLATVYVSSDSGATYVKVAEVKDPDFVLNQDLVDVTSVDDGIFKSDIRGHLKATLSFTCNYDPTDAGQEKILNAAISGTGLMWKFRPQGDTTAYKEYLFTGNLSSHNITPPTQGVTDFPVSVETSGTITRQAIP